MIAYCRFTRLRGLLILPAYEGTTFRGISSLPEDVLANNQPGRLVSDGAFMSTSSGEPFGGNVLIKVDGTSGRDISFLSEYPNEAEVLYPPGTKFEVINRVDDGVNTQLHYKEVL